MATQYTIKSGDTLGALATQFGTTISNIQALNPTITDPNKIYAGATLNLPGSTPTPTSTSIDQSAIDSLYTQAQGIQTQVNAIQPQVDTLSQAKTAGMTITPQTSVEEATQYLTTQTPQLPSTNTNNIGDAVTYFSGVANEVNTTRTTLDAAYQKQIDDLKAQQEAAQAKIDEYMKSEEAALGNIQELMFSPRRWPGNKASHWNVSGISLPRARIRT